MKLIKQLLKESLSEGLTDNIDFITASGDDEMDLNELKDKLLIIKKYFPFNSVRGHYHTDTGVDLSFDNHMSIYGDFDGDGSKPLIMTFLINEVEHKLNIHPFDSMGGFDEDEFENWVKAIYDETNSVSIIIEHEGYAVKSYTVKKSELDGYKIYLANGTQYEGKLMGKGVLGGIDFREKFNFLER